jgi:hypothetical protein
VFVYRALLHKAGQYAGRPSEVVQVRASAEIEYALWWGVPGLPSARMPPARPRQRHVLRVALALLRRGEIVPTPPNTQCLKDRAQFCEHGTNGA